LNDGDTSHEQELKNLCLLNQLKHPNILELLTFYTYQRKRNFLFPLASGGDLEALFRAEHRQTTFNEDFMFYRALSGLSDAIEKLHDYKADKNLELRLIGLHQDLKPSNILVDGDDFILADFGLSKFKSGSQTSHTPFRIGGGDYLAPECEDYDEGMRKGLVNRSSDIWSLGCIIAEVLTYMLRGAKGVVEFRDKRKVKVGAWTVKTFYTAGGKVNPNVLEWLSDLKLACPPPGQQLVELVKTILSVNQENRPEAEVVTYQLRLITINELLDSLNKLYTLTEPKVDSKHWLQTYAESLRFQSWKVAFDSIALQNSTGELSKFDVDLDQSIKRLKAIHSELSLISIRYEVGTRPVFTALQQLTGELIELLPQELQTTARSYQELQLLNDEAYLNGNDSMQNLRSIASSGSKLRYLAFVKRLLASADKQSKELELLRVKQGKAAIFVEAEKVELIDSFGDHHLALTAEDQSDAKRRVLIEWIVYDTHWDGSVMEEMVTRVGNIAHFLNEITVDARAFGLLHCAGYFHSVPRHSFGLVYNFPYDKARSTPETLNSIILDSRGKPDPPLLGDRFALARSLCSILLDLHKATLVHKSFSSRNVIFFPTSDPILSRPYLIGFNHSRPNDPTAFSLGPASRSPAARKYQDPKYVPIERFRLEFDYYSLGLVLLEIGIWDTIDNMAKKAASPAEMKETLISKRVPLLGHVVGKAYRDAVLACLCGDFGKSGEEASSNATILDFERRVLTPLSQLVA
jgi:serine/threonine protein kinase